MGREAIWKNGGLEQLNNVEGTGRGPQAWRERVRGQETPDITRSNGERKDWSTWRSLNNRRREAPRWAI